MIINKMSQIVTKPETLPDYKFFCFNGQVKFVYGIGVRSFGMGAEVGIYTSHFEKMPVDRADEKMQSQIIPCPCNYDTMVNVAEQLSKQFPHVRVDLYNVNGKIYFGELTFYDGSGYMSFVPDSFDFTAGEYFEINSIC